MSSGVRAEWHLAELTVTDDPFATAVYSAGLEVDLAHDTEDDLFLVLRALVDREGRMFNTGLICELKDAGQDCRSCPMATLEHDEARSLLCRVGKDQAAIMQRGDELRAVREIAVRDFAAIIDEYTEIGHLDAELVELLTAVGL